MLVRGHCHCGGDWRFQKAFLQVRVGPEERDALTFHCLKDLDTRQVDTLRFTRALFGLAPSPFLLAGVIEHHLDDWMTENKRPDTLTHCK